jgi:predicted lipoprotein with Yx(FWY)xxD motif
MMDRSMQRLIPTLMTAALLAACGSSASSNTASTNLGSTSTSKAAASEGAGESGGIVKSARNSSLGETILVDQQGMTLYHLSGEHSGNFICASGSCEAIWRPLTVHPGSSPTGTVSALGIATRPDGSEQVTYEGMPLYTFVKDRSPGQANGDGIKDVGTWSVISVSGGEAVTSTSSSAASSGGRWWLRVLRDAGQYEEPARGGLSIDVRLKLARAQCQWLPPHPVGPLGPVGPPPPLEPVAPVGPLAPVGPWG